MTTDDVTAERPAGVADEAALDAALIAELCQCEPGFTARGRHSIESPCYHVETITERARPLIAAAERERTQQGIADAIRAEFKQRADRLRNQDGQHADGCHTKHKADAYDTAAVVAERIARDYTPDQPADSGEGRR